VIDVIDVIDVDPIVNDIMSCNDRNRKTWNGLVNIDYDNRVGLLKKMNESIKVIEIEI